MALAGFMWPGAFSQVTSGRVKSDAVQTRQAVGWLAGCWLLAAGRPSEEKRGRPGSAEMAKQWLS